MGKKIRPIVSAVGRTADGKKLALGAERGVERFLAAQRPVVLAHLTRLRRNGPAGGPEALLSALEARYRTTVTLSGAAIGATAAVPAVGTGTALALAAAETVWFLEATTLYAQSVAEVHGLPITEPDRARTLVLALALGDTGSELVRGWAGQATGEGPTRPEYWGRVVASSLPLVTVGDLADRLQRTIATRLAGRAGAGIVSKALPFGIGAAFGGIGNRMLAQRIVRQSRRAFGATPESLPAGLDSAAGAV